MPVPPLYIPFDPDENLKIFSRKISPSAFNYQLTSKNMRIAIIYVKLTATSLLHDVLQNSEN